MNDTSDNLQEQWSELTDFIKALTGETRQQILALFACGPQEYTVNEISEALEIGQSTASENLTALKRSGILKSRREGKTVFYRPDRTKAFSLLDRLRHFLDICCPEE